MDSPQSITSLPPHETTSSVFPGTENQTHPKQSHKSNLQQNKSTQRDSEEQEHSSTGAALEVYIDQARDIHNICIYQKQDVYAKLSLTSDPEKAVSTKIVNGGGHNPVFNETLRLSLPRFDSSLKCEIWMLSRVRNYLEDQLLGFALVPVSEILLHNGKLEREFSLSSTDLFHSPAGFVQLSVSYLGTRPEVVPIETEKLVSESCGSVESGTCDLDKIEFPDPRVANEEQCMVEEYFSLPCPPNAESDNSESLVTSTDDTEENNHKGSDFLSPKINSPPSSSFECSSVSAKESKPLDDGPTKADAEENGSSSNGDAKEPVVAVRVEPAEPKVVQQEIVDMYMKSMQQFTESLAKMKLPTIDVDSPGPAGSDGSSDGSGKNSGSRVFYGSRAFF